MGMHYFAVVVGEDVVTLFSFDDSFPGNIPVIAGMGANPRVVPTDNTDVHLGWRYLDGKFFPPEQKIVAPDYEVDDD